MPAGAEGQRIAVVLFNLGGPDRPDAIQPFLFNLFNDPAIIRLPNPIRVLLAQVVSRRRTKEATRIYGSIGGGSPLLKNTQAQAESLDQALLSALGGEDQARVFIAMRYWHPMSLETAMAVQDYQPDSVVLLPLYPQFSSTTTASSIREWDKACKTIDLQVPTRTICCYPLDQGFIDRSAELVGEAYQKMANEGQQPRVLFTAHGLPESIVKAGDPYQWQVEKSSQAIVNKMEIENLDWMTCYQSRVGPLEWIKPSTEDEIKRAGEEGVPLVVYPLAFVSENSETLVELDRDYGELASESGVPRYDRVKTVDADRLFIDGLADIVLGSLAREIGTICPSGSRLCPSGWANCPAGALS